MVRLGVVDVVAGAELEASVLSVHVEAVAVGSQVLHGTGEYGDFVFADVGVLVKLSVRVVILA